MINDRKKIPTVAGKQGTPSMWNVDQVMPIILERMAEGESLTSICKSKEYPSINTVLRWIFSDPILEKEYESIRRVRAEAEFEKTLDIADSMISEGIKGAKLRIDTRKWWVEKASPKFKDKAPEEEKEKPLVNINFTPEALEKLREIATDLEHQTEGDVIEEEKVHTSIPEESKSKLKFHNVENEGHDSNDV